ncbi:MAG: dUTP diphosphatase [Ferruginibacter sp.]
MIKISIVNNSNNPAPSYATPGSAGMDIRANLSLPVALKPLERQLIPTGLFIALPENYEAQIRPRSGLAFKHGLTCLNTPGTIDSDYRGEIKVLLINLSNEEAIINNNDRVAQMLISKVEKAELIVVHQLDETERGSGGFGHTGIQ